MKILLTGANGYIGRRLLPLLLQEGHQVVVLVRSKERLPDLPEAVEVIEADLATCTHLENLPKDLDAAYFLVHSLSQSQESLLEIERRVARNFLQCISTTNIKQVIYLSGLVNAPNLSNHLLSRKSVEETLSKGPIPLTTLRAGIIIGAGSASFEIMRDLVEKLPVMVAPRWVKSQCQPIAISDVLFYLVAVLNNQDCLGQSFDVGGPDVLTYYEMLMQFAKIRGLHRWILRVPVLTPKLSSYWLYFVTSTNFTLARSLVDSLKNDAVCSEHRIQTICKHECLSFEESLRRVFAKIEERVILSSWKDALHNATLNPHVPEHGCLKDVQEIFFACSPDLVCDAVWAIGGNRGWYAMNWAWKFRGFLDQIFGGVGLRRGRTHPTRLRVGDALDFWRVLVVDQEKKRLLLYAEMKLPGEAWLEFKVEKEGCFVQQATFRPRGIMGRLYWYLLFPFHFCIFRRMARAIVVHAERENSN